MNPLPQRTSSAAWVRGIAELFAAEGLPVQALCAQADIDLESLQHPHTRVDVDRVSRLWEAAAQHYARPGLGLDRQLAARYGKPAFVVNPPDTDELCDLARVTGVRGVYRHVHLHALNLKETAIRHAASLGRRYEELDLIVCHIGGGISVSAHHDGRMVDGFDIVGGEGMMAPTRCGALPVSEVLNLIDAGRTTAELRRLCMKTGGFVDLLGTSDAREVQSRAAAGDAAAKRAWDALLYQLTKAICSMAGVLAGHVDGILLGGGMAHSQELVDHVRDTCGWVAT